MKIALKYGLLTFPTFETFGVDLEIYVEGHSSAADALSRVKLQVRKVGLPPLFS